MKSKLLKCERDFLDKLYSKKFYLWIFNDWWSIKKIDVFEAIDIISLHAFYRDEIDLTFKELFSWVDDIYIDGFMGILSLENIKKQSKDIDHTIDIWDFTEEEKSYLRSISTTK